MSDCAFLIRLPAEIRVSIYEYILSFEKPLKLRQWQDGSRNTSILRTNRQIFHEATPVLYESNKIIVTRNDFCLWTDSDLQTPIPRNHVRKLLIKNFAASIRCSASSSSNFDDFSSRCDVCQPSPDGFVKALAALPRLRSAVIDYQHQPKEFESIKDTLSKKLWSDEPDYEPVKLVCTDIAEYRMESFLIPPHLTIQFANIAMNALWRFFSSLDPSVAFSDVSEDNIKATEYMLQGLRDKVDRELPDKIYLLHWLRHRDVEHRDKFRFWIAMDAARCAGQDANFEMDILDGQVQSFCAHQDLASVKRRIREWQAMHLIEAAGSAALL